MLSPKGRLRSGVITACAVTIVMVSGGLSSAQATGARRASKHRIGRRSSANWSGYAIDATGVTRVIGTWTEPAVACAAGETTWSAPWVGIDGDNSNPVEQTGTDSDCTRGRAVYYAWYEMYPKSLVRLSMTVRPGDSFTGMVTYDGGSSFTLRLIDNTTRASFVTTQSARNAPRSSVEWIMEGPPNGPLPDFGSVPFSAAAATINGRTAGLSSFAGAKPITMATAGTVRAQPSPLSANAFSVAWKSGYAGPRPGTLAPGHG